MSTQFTQLSDHIFIHHGSINVGILRDGNRALLIDCGAGRRVFNPLIHSESRALIRCYSHITTAIKRRALGS